MSFAHICAQIGKRENTCKSVLIRRYMRKTCGGGVNLTCLVNNAQCILYMIKYAQLFKTNDIGLVLLLRYRDAISDRW